MAPLAPEKVRPLILTPFSLTYTGVLKIADLNTELLFLARAVCAPTQTVAGGIGIIGGEALLIDVTFSDVTIDDVATPLVIQGLTLTGNLTFSGNLTSFGILHIGYNSLKGDLSFGCEVTVASLEIYECTIAGDIVLPSGASLVSILVYGQYPQILLEDLSNKKIYPSLTSLLYLNIWGQRIRCLYTVGTDTDQLSFNYNSRSARSLEYRYRDTLPESSISIRHQLSWQRTTNCASNNSFSILHAHYHWSK